MRPDARKIWVVASTEFGSLIRTKAFLITLLMFPIIYGLSIGLQLLVAKRVDTRARTFAVVDRTGALYPTIERAAETYNKMTVDAKGQAIAPRLEPSQAAAEAAAELELSDRIRRGQLDAFVVIPAEAVEVPAAGAVKPPAMEYHSDNPNDNVIRNWLAGTVNTEVRARRCRTAGVDASLADRLNQPVGLDNLGLVERKAPATAAGPGAPAATTAEKVDPVRTIGVPLALLIVMFMIIMSTTPQLLNSVIEEKMSKISEVLLGSVTPFELMMGKLLGNTGIAAVLAAIYVSGGFAAAAYYGYADAVSAGIMAALALYMVLAILLYGSLFMAVGAACSELKDAQSLMLPVLLLTMLPMFVLSAILTNPSSTLSVGLSLFPPASPYLMLMRLAMRPSPPAWQVGLSIVGTTVTALFCVWAAAKIFRTGLLMQGKAPSYGELVRWVMAK
jgi:ABC-type Na+ efflux pump permease subunit